MPVWEIEQYEKEHTSPVSSWEEKGCYFWHCPKIICKAGYSITINENKAEKPGSTPKIRKLAVLKQYGFLNGILPGFSPAERFFRQRARG